MVEYIDIEQAKTLSRLRLVLPPDRPNLWKEKHVLHPAV